VNSLNPPSLKGVKSMPVLRLNVMEAKPTDLQSVPNSNSETVLKRR
jgi:hypothetical protein